LNFNIFTFLTINQMRKQKPKTILCPLCKGDGLSKQAKKLTDDFNNFRRSSYTIVGGKKDGPYKWSDKITDAEVKALVKEGRLRQFTHESTNGHYNFKLGIFPKAEVVNEAQRCGETEDGINFFHDDINERILVKFRAKRYGIPYECRKCHGAGEVEKLTNESFTKLMMNDNS